MGLSALLHKILHLLKDQESNAYPSELTWHVLVGESLITARNSSCGKVMFSQVCVRHSVQRGIPSLAGEGVLSLAGGRP